MTWNDKKPNDILHSKILDKQQEHTEVYLHTWCLTINDKI